MRSKLNNSRSPIALMTIGALSMSIGVYAERCLKSSELSVLVELEPASYDFGRVTQGDAVSHRFRLHNASTSDVEFVKVKVTCGCTTTPDLEGLVLRVGADHDVPVTMNTAGKDGKTTVWVTLFFRKRGAKGPPLLFKQIAMSATIEPDYRVSPTVIDFGDISELSGRLTRRVQIRPILKDDLRITGVECSDRYMSALPADPPAGGTIDYLVTLDAGQVAKPGPLYSKVELKTNSPSLPSTTLTARGHFRPSVTFEPDAVVVGAGETGGRRRLYYHFAKPYHMRRITPRAGGVVVERTLPLDQVSGTVELSIHNLESDPAGSSIDFEIGGDWEGNGRNDSRVYRVPVIRIPIK